MMCELCNPQTTEESQDREVRATVYIGRLLDKLERTVNPTQLGLPLGTWQVLSNILSEASDYLYYSSYLDEVVGFEEWDKEEPIPIEYVVIDSYSDPSDIYREERMYQS